MWEKAFVCVFAVRCGEDLGRLVRNFILTIDGVYYSNQKFKSQQRLNGI